MWGGRGGRVVKMGSLCLWVGGLYIGVLRHLVNNFINWICHLRKGWDNIFVEVKES